MTILSPNERLITISLHSKPKCSCEIAEDLDKGDTVISNNLRRMQQSKIVTYQRTGIRKKYKLTRYGDSLYKLLSTHDASFRDLVIDYNEKKKEANDKCLR